MALTQITITGTLADPNAGDAAGTGTATLSHRIVNGSTVVEPEPIEFQLNASGQVVNMSGLPLVVYANDDTGTEPTGSFYTFVLEIDSAPIDPFEAVISHLAPGGTVDLSTLIPSLP